MQEIIPGRCYRHFKGNQYRVICIATHSETMHKLVVYQALYDPNQFYARPYELFAGSVEHEKYPDITQKNRFQLVTDEGD